MDGHLVGHGAKGLDELPLRRFCSFIWWMATRNAEEKDVENFRIQLWRPPLGYQTEIPAESPWSPENESKAFQSLKASLNA